MTPTLDSALEAFVGDGSWYRLGSSDASGEPDRARALMRRHADLENARGYGVLFSILASGLIGLFLMAGESPWLLMLPTVLVAGTLLLTMRLRAERPDGPCPTTAFLAAALPRLRIGPVQRRYAEALFAVHSGEARDPGGDGLLLLRHLAEEEDRLLTLARTVDLPDQAEIAAEARELRIHYDAVRDPAAREALAQSLTLAERRLQTAERAASVRERLEAHRILLDQSSRTASEGIKGWNDLSAGLDDLRENVASLGREAAALEAAVQEMRAL